MPSVATFPSMVDGLPVPVVGPGGVVVDVLEGEGAGAPLEAFPEEP